MEVLVGTYIAHMIYYVPCGSTKVYVMEDKLRDIVPQSPSLIVQFLKNPFNFQILINLPWLVTASTVILIKYKEMLTGGYRISERALGRSRVKFDGDTYSSTDIISFYSSDILLCYGIIPLCLLIIYKLTDEKIALFVSSVLSLFTLVLLYIQVQSVSITGTTTYWYMFVDSIIFAFSEPDIAIKYLSLGGLIKFILLLTFTVFATYISYLSFNKYSNQPKVKIFFNSAKLLMCIFLFVVLFVNSLAFFLNELPKTNYHQSVLMKYALNFVGYEERTSFSLKNPNVDKLYSEYKKLADINVGNVNYKGDSFGTHKNSDLVIIILETAPSAISPLSIDNKNLPNMASLLPNSIFSNNHYSTFPYTNLAIFSLFTSWYSNGETFNLFEQNKPELPSFIKPLKRSGYKSKLYIPCDHSFKFDELFYKRVGLESSFMSCHSEEYSELEITEQTAKKINKDKIAFNKMLQDIEINYNKNQNYAYVFAPQIGHAPWPKLSNEKTLKERGEAIVSLQDEWIGELVNLLNKHNKLEDTVIVITGDHGIRTKKEDPKFKGNIIDDYSFRVPLIIHAPKSQTIINKELNFNTSHVDISPTIMNLMGIDYPQELLQGRSVTLQPIKRTLFFNAKFYLGSDGYYQNDTYYSYNSTTGEVFSSNKSLDFSKSTSVIINSENSKLIKNKIKDFYSLQNFWQKYHFDNSIIWE